MLKQKTWLLTKHLNKFTQENKYGSRKEYDLYYAFNIPNYP